MNDRPEFRGSTGRGDAVLSSLDRMGLDSYAPYLMNRIMGRYNAALRAEMAALGLTTPKMRALAVLTAVPHPMIGELAAYAVVEPSTLSRALAALEADGLVRRDADAGDSRAVRVSLTPAGRAAFDRLWPHMVRAHERIFAGISGPDRRTFVTTLGRMLDNVRRSDGVPAERI